jgi:glucose-6-phosphate isomerase
MTGVLALDPGRVAGTDDALRRLVDEDAVGQLIRADGRFAELGSDGGRPRLDWVSEVDRLLADPDALEPVEELARRLRGRGVRRVIWSGMGGSVNTVRALVELGFCRGDGNGIAVHPLDSTDPAALNELISMLGAADGGLATLLADVHMVAVSMGITSEEPVSHATWFLDLLASAGLAAAEHLTVLTVDGSHLGRFAAAHGLPTRPVFLADRTGIPGRMSAPGTLVFLLPVALHFAGTGGGQLRLVLREAWRRYDLAGTRADPRGSSFVRLAAALAAAARNGGCGLALSTVERQDGLLTWIEQLLEQSLGKGGKGVLVLRDQFLGDQTLGDRLLGERRSSGALLRLTVPEVAEADPVRRLAELAAMFLGWQLCAALYGYLHEIRVVDEPAVERYKAHTRRLMATRHGGRHAMAGPGDRPGPARLPGPDRRPR